MVLVTMVTVVMVTTTKATAKRRWWSVLFARPRGWRRSIVPPAKLRSCAGAGGGGSGETHHHPTNLFSDIRVEEADSARPTRAIKLRLQLLPQ